jgi:hypothetical protein
MFGDIQIAYFGYSIVKKYVRGFDISMDDVRLMKL